MSFEVPSLPLLEAGPVFAVLVAVVLAAPLVARIVRVPDVVVLLVAGMVVGPTGLGLLEREGAVALLGSAGLLYLMFLAGLELDLDDFLANRAASYRFGVLTFVVPITLGTASAFALGFDLLPAVLIGSCWASHTLLAYPQFRRAGTAGHRVVAATVGATIITDTAALLVLVVVVRAHEGDLSAAFWLTLVPAFGALVLGTLVGLPRIARRFFAGPGQDPTLRLLFVLLCLFTVAGLTAAVGVEPIIGAFVAGLALNRSVPNGGALMERVELLGGALFVPLFLVATGMLVDLRLLLEPRILGWGAAFTVVATLSKLLAAMAAGRLLRATATEVGAMFALSNAQAAATLAAVVVGLEVGLLGDGVVDAVVLVILVTCVVSSLVAARVAPRLRADDRDPPLGSAVVVPVVNPATAGGLLELAGLFARADAGVLVPVVVAPTGSDAAVLQDQRALLATVVRAAQSAGAEARPVLRIDATPADGIAHTVTEAEASLLVLGWQGRSTSLASALGGVVDPVLDAVQVPTLVLHDGPRRARRVLVVLDEGLVRGRGSAPVALGLRAGAEVARARRIPLEVVATSHDEDLLAMVTELLGRPPTVRPGRRAAVVAELATGDDLVVLPSLADAGSLRALVSRVLRAVPADASTLVTVVRGARSAASMGTVRLPRAAPEPPLARPEPRR